MPKTMIQIIDETAGAFTSETRAKFEEGCMYQTSDGRCCAVGRCMEDPLSVERKLISGEDSSATAVDELFGLDSLLKPEYRGHSVEFWERLQGVHDNELFWDENGLTERGGNGVQKLKKWARDNA